MAFHFQHSFLSELYTDTTLSAKELGWVLRELGNSRSDIVAFFREFSKTNDCILFDGTDINSCSEKIGINKNGKSKKGTYDKLINLMFVFSVGQQLPIYYRITPGNIKDVKSFKLCLKESGVKDAVIIADKGFYSESNVKQLNGEGLKFIVPLKRDSLRIDYSKVKQADKQIFDNYFKFEDRFIWHYTLQSGQFKTVVYLDLELKTREERDFLDRIETCPKKFTIEKFHQKQHTFGTISLLNNLEKTPKEIYEDYKSRDEIELMIDTLKNVVEADRSYMQDEQALEGWMFINYIALHWYYKLFLMLIKKELNKVYSPADFLKILSEVRKVKINESWHNTEITRKTAELIGKVGVHIT